MFILLLKLQLTFYSAEPVLGSLLSLDLSVLRGTAYKQQRPGGGLTYQLHTVK